MGVEPWASGEFAAHPCTVTTGSCCPQSRAICPGTPLISERHQFDSFIFRGKIVRKTQLKTRAVIMVPLTSCFPVSRRPFKGVSKHAGEGWLSEAEGAADGQSPRHPPTRGYQLRRLVMGSPKALSQQVLPADCAHPAEPWEY